MLGEDTQAYEPLVFPSPLKIHHFHQPMRHRSLPRPTFIDPDQEISLRMLILIKKINANSG